MGVQSDNNGLLVQVDFEVFGHVQGEFSKNQKINYFFFLFFFEIIIAIK